MNVSWIFFTFLLLIHTVPVQSVEGFIGESVILPCTFAQNPPVVFWRDEGTRTVCDISGGEASFDEQHSNYKHRVQIFPSKIKEGNFSIKLSNLQHSDGGTYTCTDPSKGLDQQVQLKVEEKPTTPEGKGRRVTPESTSTPRNGDSPRRADDLLTFLLGCALLYSLTF
ncbi:coxsackievirus and adenovirus receptor homolog [Ictalurus punctatus]|uniref:Coxsackievirus and adenovirus receptor homolog n=1 Tax=Ictalurus punctatus TaxID=7998 RepID=A0A9F7R0I0_ICTPU|nr:coxsackievirus and adenovirus receptor homolog [Ictalurus punctatus]